MTEATGRASSDVRLAHDTSAAREARRLVAEFLARQHVPTARAAVSDSTLVVHELVLNAATHGAPDGRGGIGLSLRVQGDELAVTVHDGGTAGTVAHQPSSATREGGRGLAMVDALTNRWAVDRSAGTSVTAWLSL